MTDSAVPFLGAAEIASKVRSRELSAREVTDAVLGRIERINPVINAWAVIDAEGARAQAERIDAEIARGNDPGVLAGVPLGVKDLEDAAGFRTGYGSALHLNDAPASVDSVQVARLRAAGCVVLGKTTTSEFGYSGDTVTPGWGATLNPWSTKRSSGGSSGGSGAALAAGMTVLATGSDAGGSIRIPAALCGLTALKTTHGVVPLGQGIAPSGGALTVRGPMGRRACDTAAALAVVAGPHPTDPFSLPSLGLDGIVRPTLPERIVWAPSPGFPVDSEVAAVCASLVARLAEAGTEVIEVDSIYDPEPIGDWFTLWAIYRERAHGHLRDTSSWELFDEGLRALMDHGAQNVSAKAAMAALDAIHVHAAKVAAVLDRAPFLVTPTVAGQTAVSGHHGTVNGEPTIFWAPFTQAANLTRHPAGSVCVGLTADGMPVGIQVTGAHAADAALLDVLAGIEGLVGTPTWPVEA
jgi:aspartyl-tRNA(Asn)/glutamyl-tRNA(Gln) amidotransferase subunit A